MKNVIAILALLFYVILLAGQDSLSIGFSLGDFYVERWYKDRDFFKEEANALGAHVDFEYAYGDADKQVELSKKLIDSGLKVLVVVPVDAEKSADIIDYAHQKGVIVISYDRLIKNSDLDYYISFDNLKVGELQAQYAVNIRPKGNYVLLAGPKSDNNALLFLEGQKKILEPYIKKGDIKIILEKHLGEWSSIVAFSEIQNLVGGENPKIDVIIASNDQLASGSIMALDMQFDDWDVVITGQDALTEACKNIAMGKQSMTVYKSIRKLAQVAAEIAVKLINGENITNVNSTINNGKINVPSILLEPVSVDRNNLKQTVIAEGFVKEEDIY